MIRAVRQVGVMGTLLAAQAWLNAGAGAIDL